MSIILLSAFFFDLLTTYLRYGIVSWLPAYLLKSEKWQPAIYEIQSSIPKKEGFEVKTSIIAILYIGVVDTLFYYFILSGQTKIYFNIAEHSLFFYFSNFLILFFLHDFYFYITHRILHIPFLFRKIHYIHHQTKNPSALASYCFHPIEACIQALFFPLIFIWPFHFSNFGIFFFLSLIYNSYGHSGYEFLDNRRTSPWRLSYWFNTSIYHHDHHSLNRGNFGLYTRIWDVIFKTVSPIDYLKLLKISDLNKDN